MKKMLLSIVLVFTGISASATVPYNITEQELQYQVNYVDKTCVFRDLKSRNAYIRALEQTIWWVDEKPLILNEFKERVIFINTYANGNSITMVFTRTHEACTVVSKTLFDSINK